MPLTIGNNIASLKALRNLNHANSSLSVSYARLSSGQRINSASDDAAGLSIAESLKAKRQTLTRGIANLNDGISVLRIADGATSTLEDILIRLKELATQASNGSLNTSQRNALDKEAQALIQEHDRIVSSTKFNGISLFDQSNTSLSLQAGTSTLAISMSGTATVGSGNFESATTYYTGGEFYFPLAGDFNGDGIIDIAGVSKTSGYLNLMLGNGDGTFKAASRYNLGGDTNANQMLLDVDDDGNLDVVISDNNTGFYVLRGNGDGTFKESAQFVGPSAAFQGINYLDANGDGILDIVLSHSNHSAALFLGNGDGTFQAGVSISPGAKIGSGGIGIATDLNGDGFDDLVGGDAGTAYITLSNGDGTFRASMTIGGMSNPTFAIGDINGDGIPDLAASYQGSNQSFFFLGNGDGTFKSVMTVTGQGGSAAVPVLADINGDGNLDYLTLAISSGRVLIGLGNGDGTFQAAVTYSAASTLGRVVVADLNGDGVPDLLTSSGSGGQYSVLLGIGETKDIALATRTLEARGINLKTASGAQNSQKAIDDQLLFVTSIRSSLGASQSRVSSALTHLASMNLNYQAAESRIRDVDVAEELSKLLSNQILQQTATATLAQANQQHKTVLAVLFESPSLGADL